MATKPTRSQQQACDDLAGALLLVIGAARQDGRAVFGREELKGLLERISRASSAFGAEEIVLRALGRRVRDLGMPSTSLELLTLIEGEVAPREMLLLDDEALRRLLAEREEELGGL